MAISTRILSQVTATEWSAFEKFLDYMPNVDDFLREIGETIDVYNKMLTDEEIGADLEVRKKSLLSYNFNITTKEDDEKAVKVKEFIEKAISGFSFYRLLEHCLTALEFGYAVVEIVWQDPKENDGYWLPKESILLKPQRFALDFEGNLQMLVPEQKKLQTKYKFIVHRHGFSPENPYGISVLRRCYWPWRFKRAGWEFWMITAEKFGVPSILAIFDTQGKTEEQIQRTAQLLADALRNIRKDAGVAVAGVTEIKVLEAKGMDGFERLIELANRAISKAITGQVLATGEAKHGTRAQATVHENILYEIVDADARNLAETINRTLIPWLVELNFGPDAPVPRFEFDLSEETPWERVREAMDRGVPLSKKALYERYGLPEPEDDQDTFLSPKAGGMVFSDRKEFAEGDPDFFGQLPLRRKFRPIW